MENRIFGMVIGLLVACPAFAADFCVSTAAQLAQSLNIADNNGQDDTVRLVQGTYVGNFIYNANAAETGSLTVAGGYTADCLSRTVDPSNTVLQGNGGRTLLLSGRDNSSLLVEGVTVRDGQSQLGGAGLDIGRWTSVTVTENLFTANQTASGFDGSGGLNIDRSAQVNVSGNQFVGNNGGKGGGLSLSDPVLATIDGNLFFGNSVEQDGGAIDGDSAGRFVITNNIIAGNSSAEDAAGIGLKLFVDGSSGTADIINNTVTGNMAGQEGGGIDLKMIDDTTSANLFNNIVFGNTAGLLGRDLFIDNDDEQNGIASPVALFNNDFDQSGLGLFIAVPFAVDPSNLNNINPLFVDAPAGNYALQATSPLIDAGSSSAPALPASDFSGGARISGPAPDIGAMETVVVVDTDGDGIADNADNCTLVANPAQIDTNGDGFGNRCDADLNNNGVINFEDLLILQGVFFSSPLSPNWNPDADFNVDNLVNFLDLSIMSASFFGQPGPSGLVN